MESTSPLAGEKTYDFNYYPSCIGIVIFVFFLRIRTTGKRRAWTTTDILSHQQRFTCASFVALSGSILEYTQIYLRWSVPCTWAWWVGHVSLYCTCVLVSFVTVFVKAPNWKKAQGFHKHWRMKGYSTDSWQPKDKAWWSWTQGHRKQIQPVITESSLPWPATRNEGLWSNPKKKKAKFECLLKNGFISWHFSGIKFLREKLFATAEFHAPKTMMEEESAIFPKYSQP